MPVYRVPSQYSTIFAALDEASQDNLTPTNRGTLVLAPGRYNERVDDYVSHLDIIAEVPGTAIIELIEAQPTSGGTYRVAPFGDPENVVVDKLLYGLRIIRNDSGLESGPPEAALYIGREPTGSPTDFPANRYWDNIIIKNCIIEGVHDGIQCFGQGTPSNPSAPPSVGLVLIQDCIIRCAHDALTMKGNMRMISKNNHIRVDSRRH